MITKRSYVVNPNISLHYIPMEKLKTTNIGIFIHRKLDEETASMNALLPYVLKRGCKLCKNDVEIAKYLENLYGATLSSGILKKGEDHLICFDAETISDSYAPNGESLLGDLLELLLSIVFYPNTENGAFPRDVVKREKENAVDKIKGVINDKRTYAQLKCAEEMCKGEPYAIYRYGSIEGIEKITPESLYEYYNKMICSSKIDIFVSGEADIEEIAEKIKEVKLPFSKGEIPYCDILAKSEKVNVTEEKMEVTQGKLVMGFTTSIKPDDKEFFPLIVMNSIFGAGTHSKLFTNVREKMSLCYYAASRLEKFKGILLVDAGIEFENYKKAYDEILAQLELIKKGEISDFEYESAIISLVNSYQSIYDDPRAMAGLYMGEMIAKTEYSLSDYIKKIKEVTKEDIRLSAEKVKLNSVYFLKGMEEDK